MPQAAEQPGLVFILEDTAPNWPVVPILLYFPLAPVTEQILKQRKNRWTNREIEVCSQNQAVFA